MEGERKLSKFLGKGKSVNNTKIEKKKIGRMGNLIKEDSLRDKNLKRKIKRMRKLVASTNDSGKMVTLP